MKHSNFRQRAILLFITAVVFLSLTGCWDKVEVETTAFVTAMGIDLGKNDKLEITYVISNPQGGGFSSIVGSSQKEPPEETITMSSPDILSTRDLLGASVSRKVTYAHMKTLVVSEEMARSNKLMSTLDQFIRDRQLRRDIFVIISKEKASEFFKGNDPKLETRPHKFFELMSERWKDNALVPISNINKLIQRYESKAGLFINIYGTTQPIEPKLNANEDEYRAGEIPKTGGNTIQLIGSAVLKDGNMIGILDGEETRLCMHLRPHSTFPSLQATFPDPIDEKKRITIRFVKEEDNRFKLDLKGESPKLEVMVPLQVDLLSIPSDVDYAMNLENQKLLANHIKEQVTEKAITFIERTQKEFKGDPFLWSEIVRKRFATWDEYEKYNWMERYPEAEITVKYEIEIRRIGKQGEPLSKTG